MNMKRNFHSLLLLLFVMSLLIPASATAGLSVGSATLQDKKRVGRVLFEYTYVVEVTNTGERLEDVQATLSSTSRSTAVVDGALNFGNIAAGATVTSLDTYTIRQNRTIAFDPAVLVFAFNDTTPPVVTLPLPPVLSLDFGIKQLQFSWPAVSNATYYRLMENPDGLSGYTQIGADLTETSSTLDIAVHRQDWANARYLLQACNSEGCSRNSNEVSTLGSVLSAIGYIKASNTDSEDGFGGSVALSGDGNTLAVGARREDSNATGISTDGSGEGDNSVNRAGAVYLFSRSGAAWSQQAYIKASNTDTGDFFGDFFGNSVALSDDGNTLAVGARGEGSNATGISTDGSGEDDNTADGAGAVYLFSRSGDVWSQQAYIKASNTDSGDGFGGSVALSDDGNTLAVGAAGEDSNATGISTDGRGEGDNSVRSAGAVYLFSRSGTAWSQQTYIKASNTDSEDGFGGVALSGDGNTLAVGAWREDSNATGISTDGRGEGDNSVGRAGAVYLFSRSGDVWSQQAYIKASNTGFENAFGVSVALSGDGNTLAVGASREGSIDGSGEVDNLYSGAVYLFSRSGAAWSQQAYVKASNINPDDEFGSSVALSSDGNTLAVGAVGEGSAAIGISTDGSGEADNGVWRAGAVYLFSRSGAAWSQQAYIKASNTDTDDFFGDFFGSSVALSDDGNTLAVGAPWEDSNATGITNGADAVDNTAIDAGAVYLY